MSDQYKPNPGEFCWNELMTTNVSKAKEFYCGLFGWESTDMDMGESTYTIFKQGDKEIAGMMQTPAEAGNTPPCWTSYVMVEDLEKALAKAASLGAEIQVPITPVGEIGRLAVILDPHNATIALWQSLKA